MSSRGTKILAKQKSIRNYDMAHLVERMQRLSSNPRRVIHSSARCLSVTGLHAPPSLPTKPMGASLPMPIQSSLKSPSPPDPLMRDSGDSASATIARPVQGTLGPNSIFESTTSRPSPGDSLYDGTAERNLENMARVLNPRPRARALWHRKMVVRALRKRGRLNKEEKILQTERSHRSGSDWIETSVKKLSPLARQIAGKTVDEALLQMRFSKKKAAKSVQEHLVRARNQAVVVKGMGLGQAHSVTGELGKDVSSDTSREPVSSSFYPTLSLKRGSAPDPTRMYIAQAWVNRGPFTNEIERRAMGRMNVLRHPKTRITVLLKEERTRTRETQEKEAREREKRLGKLHWRQLPDRRIYTQRPYYTW